MKWYALLSAIVYGLNSVLATIVLSLSVYHLFTNKSTNAPIAPNEEWITLVTSLVPLAAVWMTVSVLGIFVSLMKRQIILASLILVIYATMLGGAIYFTVAFSGQLEMKDFKAEELFAIVQKETSAHGPQPWIPLWLENIQKQSSQCCGIITYRDFADFWPADPTKIPRSCCRNVKDIPDDKCPDDITRIPFPNTPDNYIKVEVGCMQEINEAVRRNVEESLHLSITMTAFLACGLVAFATVFICRYLIGNNASTKTTGDKPLAAGDAEMVAASSKENVIILDDSGPIFIASSKEFMGTLDSFANVPSLMPQERIMQSLSGFPVPPLPPQESSPPSTNSRPPPPAASAVPMRSQPSILRSNKANTVFAGLQKPASTGDDMTVGGGNLGRREVFVVQDNRALPAIPEIGSRQRLNAASNTRLPPSSSQNDMAGDIVHVDEEPADPAANPQGKPEKSKKKKGKKFGLPHGHNR